MLGKDVRKFIFSKIKEPLKGTIKEEIDEVLNKLVDDHNYPIPNNMKISGGEFQYIIRDEWAKIQARKKMIDIC